MSRVDRKSEQPPGLWEQIRHRLGDEQSRAHSALLNLTSPRQAGHFRFNEQRVLGENEGLPPPYVRAFLGQCKLISEEEIGRSEILLYPVLLIFQSGIPSLIVMLEPLTPREKE